ncbi:MAG: transglutaminase-like domain-containing protein [Chloroflexota bacterium]|nr:transglutaminase-like domain-containing protein [Chloroflexota bacterium]
MEKYLECTNLFDYETESVTAKAKALTAGLETAKDKAIAIFNFSKDEIRYNPHGITDVINSSRASAVLERGNGFCIQKAILLAALARAAGIPARVGFADIQNHQMSGEFAAMMNGSTLIPYHGYSELHIDGKWLIATPAFDLRMCEENGFNTASFDGENDAKFPQYSKDGRVHIEYIRVHGPHEDYQVERVLEVMDGFMDGLNRELGVVMSDMVKKFEQALGLDDQP